MKKNIGENPVTQSLYADDSLSKELLQEERFVHSRSGRVSEATPLGGEAYQEAFPAATT
jgi:hypothetical protein